MACPSCGSWAVKADRALAGRMVCARCGHPLGLAAPGGLRGRTRRRWGMAVPGKWPFWLALASLVAISTVLAAREPAPGMREVPPTAPGFPSGARWPTAPGGLGM